MGGIEVAELAVHCAVRATLVCWLDGGYDVADAKEEDRCREGGWCDEGLNGFLGLLEVVQNVGREAFSPTLVLRKQSEFLKSRTRTSRRLNFLHNLWDRKPEEFFSSRLIYQPA